MTDIMKLADDYAQHKYVNGAEGRGPDAPEARTGYARAALQSAIEALQSAGRTIEQLGYTNAGGELWKPPIGKAPDFNLIDQLRADRDQLQSKLGDAIQSSAHWQHQCTELQAENERMKAEREKDAFRLVWAMNWMRMSVHDHGFTKHVLERGGTADYSDCATYIDKCAGANQEAAHGIGGTQ